MKLTRNRISGFVGTVWGGAILAAKMSGTTIQTAQSSAYATGQTVALVFGILLLGAASYLVFGVLLFGAGLYYVGQELAQVLRNKVKSL